MFVSYNYEYTRRFGMNKIFSLITTLIFALCLNGYNSGGTYTTKNMTSEDCSNSYMKMIYKSFDGYKYKKININKGEKLKLNIDVTTKDGELEVLVLNENNDEIYSTTNPKKEINKEIKIDKDGKYTIKIDGDEHSGSYDVEWKLIK